MMMRVISQILDFIQLQGVLMIYMVRNILFVHQLKSYIIEIYPIDIFRHYFRFMISFALLMINITINQFIIVVYLFLVVFYYIITPYLDSWVFMISYTLSLLWFVFMFAVVIIVISIIIILFLLFHSFFLIFIR